MTQSLIPRELPEELQSVAQELDRLHESVLWSGQGQFEQMKLWRSLNLVLGVPAAVLAAVSGGTGLASTHLTKTPAILALIAAAFGAALTTLNPSRRVAQSQASANAYLELQTSLRQLLTIKLVDMSKQEAMDELGNLSDRRDEVNRTADPPSRYAYWMGKRNITRGGQTYDADKG